MKVKIGIFDHMNNTFRNTVFYISVDVSLRLNILPNLVVQISEYGLKYVLKTPNTDSSHSV